MKPLKTPYKISAVWLFILLNIIFRDIHQMTLKSHLEMLLTGTYNGMEVTDLIMLIGGVVVEIPIAMFLFALIWPRRISRPANLISVVLFTATVLFTPPTDPDDVFFLVIVLLALGWIGWKAWTWKELIPAPRTVE